MKQFFTLLLACLALQSLSAQNSFNSGDGWGAGWGMGAGFAGSAGGSLIYTTTNASGAGNRYFRFFGTGTPCGHYGPNGGGDVQLLPNTPYFAPTLPCWGGSFAYYLNVSNTTDNWVFKSAGATAQRMIVFRVQGPVRTVSTVTRNFGTVLPGLSPTITATLSGTQSTGQNVYLRYTTDNWASSTVVAMSGSGTIFTASIPNQSAGVTVRYYVFTSGTATPSGTDADWYTINLNNNGGSNYEYTVAAGGNHYRSQASGNWAAIATWLVGNGTDWVPAWAAPTSADGPVTIVAGHTVSVAAAASVNQLTINTGGILNFSGANTLSVASGGALTNNGTFTAGSGTVHFLGTGTVTGTVAFNNVNASGGVNPGTGSLLNGTLTILPGGFVAANAFAYAPGSTLCFNTGGNFDLYAGNREWNASVTPHHLQVIGGTTLWLRDDLNRTLNGSATVSGTGSRLIWEHVTFGHVSSNLNINGNLNVQAGGQFNVYNGDGNNGARYTVNVGGSVSVQAGGELYLNQDIGDDLNVAGNLHNDGLFDSSNRTVELVGSAPQFISGSFVGASKFHYLEISNPNHAFLLGDIWVEDELRLTNGCLVLQGHNLWLEQNALVLGSFNASRMIVPTGAGSVRKLFAATGSFLFPVGDRDGAAEYSPALITLNAGSFSGSSYISVRLADEKHPNNPSATHYLTRHWTVEQNDIPGINYHLQLTYLDVDITGTENQIVSIKTNDNGANWLDMGPVAEAANQIALFNQTSFSTFTGGEVEIFPLRLLSFEGRPEQGKVRLLWRAVAESQLDYYLPEHWDGAQWLPLDPVPAAEQQGGINDYQALHDNPLPGFNYYRLRSVHTGNLPDEYSPVIAVRFDAPDFYWFIDENAILQVVFGDAAPEKVQCSVFDILGRRLQQHNDLPLVQGRLVLPLNHLPANQTYYLLLQTPGSFARTLSVLLSY